MQQTMQHSIGSKVNQIGREKWVGFVIAMVLLPALTGCSGAVSAPPTVSTTPLSVSPPIADLFPDIPTTFTISGGTPAYSTFSSNNVVLPVASSVTGNTFTVIAKSVTADTPVDITVRDTVSAAPVTAKATVKPTTLNNQITFTPVGPTGNGCGANAICSGGDAQFSVMASLNGVVLANRAIRFDATQGGFQIVTPGSNALVGSLVVNTDEQGGATVRVTANVGAPTQVATVQTTDVALGLTRKYNFVIAQQISGVGILSVLPSGDVTITGAKGASGADGTCPVGASVDYYIYGGTPPYSVASPQVGVATVSPSAVSNGNRKFTAQVTGCGKTAFIVTDATGRALETASLTSVQGAKGDTVVTDTLTVSPTALTIACGGAGSVAITGSGSFRVYGSGGGGSGFTTSPSFGAIPNTVTFSATTGSIFSPVLIDIGNSSGSLTQRVTVAITGAVGGSCP